LTAPSTARVANHRIITGPNRTPTLEVPRRCSRNRLTSTTTAVGTTYR